MEICLCCVNSYTTYRYVVYSVSRCSMCVVVPISLKESAEMFCSQCGNKLEENAKFCSNCGYRIGASVQKCSDDTHDKEIVIKEGLCNGIKGMFSVQNGHGLLTNKRFIYSKHSFGNIVAMGVFVNLTKGTYDFEIPITNIQNIREGRQGISKTIIICDKSGEQYHFYFNDKLKWEIEFRNLIGR